MKDKILCLRKPRTLGASSKGGGGGFHAVMPSYGSVKLDVLEKASGCPN